MENYWYKFKWWRARHGLTWRGIKQGINNLIIWFPVIYRDSWWDHSYLYLILRKKLELMEKGFRSEYAMSANAERDAKNMKICILLLDRLLNDDYITYNRGDNIRESYEKKERMIKQDLDLLFKILRKQIRCWWD